MNGKSRFSHSLLIAIVAGFSYYILADVDFETLKMKTFSSLGIPYKMYEMNNSVIQKKLPMPKTMYAYQQQDVLKAKNNIEQIASAEEFDEFILGLTTGLMINLPEKPSEKKSISDIYQYGMRERNPENTELKGTPVQAPMPVCNNKVSIQTEISKDDIEMYVTAVTDKNTKKIEECFKKIKVIVGNENAGFLNSIVNVNIVPNVKLSSSCTSSTTNIERRKMKKAPAVASSEDEEEMAAPEEPNEPEDFDN